MRQRPIGGAMHEHIGRYTVVRLLGAGGQGQVYEATQDAPVRRRVALKVLDHQGEDVWREARMAALLRHPHLVDVYEVGRDGARWFCAMELCDGGSLAGRGALPPRAVVEVGLQVCAALDYAWRELELVHLDLKPANLLLQHGAVKVADLGIARARGFDGEARVVRGTPRFMAPEQRVGDAVDARADVFAAGQVLRELAVGTDAVDDATLPEGAVVAPRPPPAWLAPVVERCVAPDAADRFQGMAELARALAALPVAGPGLREWAGASPPGADPGVFVGRRAELDTLGVLLGAGGLVTLKGPGGIGKSRLARQAALATDLEVVVVESPGVAKPEALVQRVGAALALPPSRDAAALEDAVGAALAGRGEVLLVLDTLEPLEGALQVLGRWRQRAPSARLLCTSRVPLGLDGERVVEVPPLSGSEAVALLEDRARTRGAEVGGDPALRELARRLDGVPLALELAAGRLGVLSPAEVLERLGLSLLRSGTLGLSERQATVRGALDWSWELLAEEERSTLAQLSVFRGGFTEADAAAVVRLRGGHTVGEALGELVRHSLVAGGERLRLLGLVQEYAAQRLESGGDRLGAEGRHGEWMSRLGLVDPTRPRGASRPTVQRALDVPNLRVAVERAVARGDAEIAALTTLGWVSCSREGGDRSDLLAVLTRTLRMGQAAHQAELLVVRADLRSIVGDLDGAEADLSDAEEAGVDPVRAGFVRGWVLLRRGRMEEARAGMAAAVAAGEATGRYVADVRLRLAIAARGVGDVEAAVEDTRRALAEARRGGDPGFESKALMVLGDIAKQRGQVIEARDHYEAGLALADALGLHSAVLSHRVNLGRALWALDELELARPHIEAAVEGFRRQGMWALQANALVALADLDLSEGRLAAAEVGVQEALAIHRSHNDDAMEGFTLAVLGRLSALRGDDREAEALLERALRLHVDGGNTLMACFDRVQLATVLRRLGSARSALDQVQGAFPAIAFGPATEGFALAVRGELRVAVGEEDAGRADLARGLALLRATTERPFLRDALCCAARALRDPALLAEAAGPGVWAPGSSAQVELERTRRALGVG